MKHLILCLTLILAAKSGFGQNLNFPDSNAIWSVYDEKYFVDGDSTYNSLDYKKYYFTNDSIVTTGSYFALLREDTIQKKVFAIAEGDAQEHLLYDFSLSISDTISVYPISFSYGFGPILIQVDLIDSILIGSDYHKRLKISGVTPGTGLDEYWIEGIGSTLGPFNSGITAFFITDVYFPTLLCFEKDSFILYNNPFYTECYLDYPVGIKENSSDIGLSIFPNPSINSLFIKSDNVIKSYKIKSQLGQIMNQEMTNSDLLSIDISNYANGVYLVSVTTDTETIVQTFTKNAF